MHIRDIGAGRVHFIGMGGISMSGLAEILKFRGCEVTGSDMTRSHLTDKLNSNGITCHIGHRAGQEAGADLVVYNSAIKPDNPELAAAKERGIPLMERAVLLGQLMGEYNLSVAVSGMHGKSTCTSMIVTLLLLGGFDPTAQIGSELTLIGGTTRVGGGDIFVAEACEYMDNFLNLSPGVAVILNIDRDHLDYFDGIDSIIGSFKKYISKIPENGFLIINGDDPNCLKAMKAAKCRRITFGTGPACEVRARNITKRENGCFGFETEYEGGTAECRLSIVGRHNVYNALAAMTAAAICGMDIREAAAHISAYKGAARRFEFAGRTSGGADIYHDYAHHPAEVRATLSAAREKFPASRIICIFQPHTYSRTKALFDEFAKCFGGADSLILIDIYAAREIDPGDISSRMLCGAVKAHGSPAECSYAGSFGEAAEAAARQAGDGDLVLTMGAGDIEGISGLIKQL